MLPSGGVLELRAMETETGRYDTATVTISLIGMNFQPYTPDTEYIKPMAIPEANWKENGVGIRRNNDYDNGSGVRDSEVSRSYSAENDLVRTDLIITPTSGIEFVVRNANADLKLWKSSTKTTEYVFDHGELAFTSGGAMYVEYCGDGNASFSYEIVAIISAI